MGQADHEKVSRSHISVSTHVMFIVIVLVLLGTICGFALLHVNRSVRALGQRQLRGLANALLWTLASSAALLYVAVLCAGRLYAKKVRRHTRPVRMCLNPVRNNIRRALLPLHHPRRGGFSRFLDLPHELRKLVYSFSALNHYRPTANPTLTLCASHSFRQALSILRTCRQIRSEATYIVMALTRFSAHSRYPFYQNISASLLKHVREVQVKLCSHLNGTFGSTDFGHVFNDGLPGMPQLQDLYITINCTDFLPISQALSGAVQALKTHLRELSMVQITVNTAHYNNYQMSNIFPVFMQSLTRTWQHGSHQGRKRVPKKDGGRASHWIGVVASRGYRALLQNRRGGFG